MKTNMVRLIIFLGFALVVIDQAAMSQVAVGTPPFNSFGGGPFDVVNLGNLNVHFVIPVLHKAGRRMPFRFDLSYDSSVWTPVTVSGVQQWAPAPNWGWKQTGRFGNITYTYSTQDCQYFVSYTNQWYTAYTQFWYTNWQLVDDAGVAHPLSGSTQGWYGSTQPNTTCSTAPPSVPSTTGTATDGSGYTLSVSNYSNATVTSPGGLAINSNGSIAITDANGNQITSDTNGHYYDTLSGPSSNTPVLTVSGSTYNYTAPGGPAHAATNYKAYTVQTNFGITSPSVIKEYGPTAVNLVDSIVLADNTSYTFTYEVTPGSCAPLPNTYQPNCVTARIASVTLPTGGKITYSYSAGSNGIEKDGSTAGLTRMLSPTTTCGSTIPTGCWQYVRSLTGGTPGPASTWTTTVTDPVGDQAVLNFVEDSTTTTSTTAATYNLYETQRLVYQGGISSTNCSATTTTNCLLSTIATCYKPYVTSCPTVAVSSPITYREIIHFYPDASGSSIFKAANYSMGLPTAIYEGSATQTLRETNISYASLGNNILDRPSSVTIIDGSGATLSKTTYAYDETSPISTNGTTVQHVSISGSRGNPTTITSTVIGTSTVSRKFSYYDTGNVYQATDVNNAITQYNYPDPTSTCSNSFPTSTTLPVIGLTPSTTYDCTGGVATAVPDLNGNVTTTHYTDLFFWRPGSIVAPWGSNGSTTTTSFAYTPYNSSSGVFAAIDSQLPVNGGSSLVEQMSTINQFGQPLYSQQREDPTKSNWDTTQVLYDSLLRATQGSMPCVYTSTTFTYQGQACPSAATGTTTFDVLGRVTKAVDGGGGQVTLAYTQNDVLQTIGQLGPAPSGENNKQKQLEYDSLGRLTSVCEITNLTGTSCGQATGSYTGYVTTYVYGANSSGYPTMTVTQGLSGSQQTRVYTYDLLGRLVSEQNPENGTTTYTYDSGASSCPGTYVGDVVQRKDAANNVRCYTYDAMHRLMSITYPGTSTDSRHFVYDGATVNQATMQNAKGKLAEAYTCPSSGSCSPPKTDIGFSYSPRGEITDAYESTPNSGGYYHTSASYWENGVLQNLMNTIAGLPNVTYGVDPAGRPSSATATTNH